MMNKKPTLTSVIFVLLLLAGLGLLFYPTLSDLYVRWQISRELARYQQIVESDHTAEAELLAEAERYNRDLAQKADQFKLEPGERNRISNLLNPMGNHMMGILSIPEINVKLPVYQGTEEKQLQSGAGWLFGSSLPVGGKSSHCVVTAHSGLVKARLFTDLEKLETGDLFYMKVLNREMAYEVVQIMVTEPADFTPLLIVPGEDLMTLYTCTPYGINTHRLLVQGRRTAAKAAPEVRPALWKLLLGLVPLFLLLVVWRKKRKGIEKGDT